MAQARTADTNLGEVLKQVAREKDIDFERWMQLDLEYIDNWSPMLDIKILAKTIPAVLSGRGAS